MVSLDISTVLKLYKSFKNQETIHVITPNEGSYIISPPYKLRCCKAYSLSGFGYLCDGCQTLHVIEKSPYRKNGGLLKNANLCSGIYCVKGISNPEVIDTK